MHFNIHLHHVLHILLIITFYIISMKLKFIKFNKIKYATDNTKYQTINI